MNFLDLIADVGVIVALIGAIVFTVSYAVFFNWRKTPAGRALMYVFLSLSAVAALVFLAIWVSPTYWGRDVIRVVTWWSVAIAMIRLVWVLWSNWRTHRPPLDLESRPRKRSTD